VRFDELLRLHEHATRPRQGIVSKPLAAAMQDRGINWPPFLPSR
jgi:hypothetical protein